MSIPSCASAKPSIGLVADSSSRATGTTRFGSSIPEPGCNGFQNAQRFEQLRPGLSQPEVFLAEQAASPGFRQHDGQRRFGGVAVEHQIGHQRHAEDGSGLRERMVAQRSLMTSCSSAPLSKKRHGVGRVSEQGLASGQIKVALDLAPSECGFSSQGRAKQDRS